MRPRAGLLAKTVLLLLAVFGAAFLSVRHLYLPYLETEMRNQLTEVSEECIVRTEDIVRRRAQTFEDRFARELQDQPFELVEGSADAIRALLAGYSAEVRHRMTGNVAPLAREFRERSRERVAARSAKLAEDFRGDAFSGLLVLLGAVLLLTALALGRGVIAPLGKLLRATERVSRGELGERVGFGGRDEVGRLGRAFDRMTTALRTSRDEIEALNRTLEDKVREKTAALEERNRELAGANERLRDTIVELEETRDALVHSETMASIGTLAGGVAHEFNNLLGGIMGCAEEAVGEPDPAEVRESLGMILRTARRACNITENLLRFSRPPAHEPRPVDLARVVREALDLVGPEAAKRGVRIDPSLRELPAVPADPGQIHQVVLNLLTNGLHSMPGGGRLGVCVRREDGNALIEVTDDGPGVPPADRARIFEPFFTTRETGTGLGLSVSYSIVRSHGGSIEVDDAEGGGARFRVRLPFGPDRPTAGPQEE